MAHPNPWSLTPSEVGFLSEMEMVTVIPAQALDSLELLGGPTQPLKPPFPTAIPLWLALLLKRQKRARIVPPPWLSIENLKSIHEFETDDRTAGVFSPPPDLPPMTTVSANPDEYLSHESLARSSPFLPDSSTSRAQADALPYHWLELSHLLLTHAADDFVEPEAVRRLIRDLREVRMSKMRKGFRVLDAGAGVKMNGVGGMEIAEVRGYMSLFLDNLRKINRSKEEARREREDEGQENDFGGNSYQEHDDEEMQL